MHCLHKYGIPGFLLIASLAPRAAGQSYTISTAVGAALPLNMAAKSTGFPTFVPSYIASDAAGDIYLVDQNTVLRLDAVSGLLTLVAGTGAQGYSGDGGPATSAKLNNPHGLAIDSAGNLYIADSSNNVVRKVSGGIITTVAGDGVAGSTCSNGPAASAGLNFPSWVAVDPSGNLYISDTQNRCIRKVSSGTITTVAGTGQSGFSGDGGPALSARLGYTQGIALDSRGNLFIADAQNDVVREVSASSGQISTVAGLGGQCCNFSGANGPATNATLSPWSVAVDSKGNLYISDPGNSLVLEVSNGTLTVVAGQPNQGLGFSGDNGPASSALLSSPEAVAVDAAGHLYIADQGNNRIREVSQDIITTIAGDGATGINGPANQAVLQSGGGLLAIDSADDLYFSGENDTIQMVSGATGIITTVAGNGKSGTKSESGVSATEAPLSCPYGVGVDSSGDLYIADGCFKQIFEVTNGALVSIAGNGQLGVSGVGGPATGAALLGPVGIAVDAAGDVYFSDDSSVIGSTGAPLGFNPLQDRVLKISNGTLIAVAGNGSRGPAGDGGPATGAQVFGPQGLALDSAGNLFIADTGNNKIRKISAQTGIITTVAGSGQQGYSGDNGAAKSAELNAPSAVAVDQAGNLYIADNRNNVVRKVSAATGIITTIAGTGVAGYSGDYGPATSAQLTPLGIAVDSAGDVFASGGGYVRVLTPTTGSSCTYSVSPPALEVPAAGGVVSVKVQTTPYCPWPIANLPAWISGPLGGTGSGSANLIVAANTGAARETSFTVGGLTATVAEEGTALSPFVAAVTNAEGGSPVIAPNTWVTIVGADLAPAGDSRTWQGSDFVNHQLPTQLDGVSATVNGKPAYVYYISPAQINILTPPDAISGSVPVEVTNNGALAETFNAQAQAVSPSFFVFNGGPYVAATHASGSLIGPATLYPGATTPAKPGETVVIYANGFGATSMPVVPGAETQSGTLSPLPVVTIGGVTAQVAFAGLSSAPGEFQFNVVVPASLSNGDQPITATYNGSATQPGTLITIHN